MVLLHVKNSASQHLWVDLPADTSVEDAVAQAVLLSNLHAKLLRVKRYSADLAKHGPLKPPQEGDDSDEEENRETSSDQAANPASLRSGQAPSEEQQQALVDGLSAAEATIAEAAERRAPVTERDLAAALRAAEAALRAAFPGGLPPWEPAARELPSLAIGGGGRMDKAGEEGDGTQSVGEADDWPTDGSAVLWFAGRCMERSAMLRDVVGRNEKTRAMVKLARGGEPAPLREAPVDADTQRAMLSWYHKRSEEWKRMDAADDGLSHADSAWADPCALRQQLTGVQRVKLG